MSFYNVIKRYGKKQNTNVIQSFNLILTLIEKVCKKCVYFTYSSITFGHVSIVWTKKIKLVNSFTLPIEVHQFSELTRLNVDPVMYSVAFYRHNTMPLIKQQLEVILDNTKRNIAVSMDNVALKNEILLKCFFAFLNVA